MRLLAHLIPDVPTIPASNAPSTRASRNLKGDSSSDEDANLLAKLAQC